MIQEISKDEYLQKYNSSENYLNQTTKKWIELISKSYKYPVKIFAIKKEEDIFTAILFFVTKNWLGGKKLIFIPFMDDISFKNIDSKNINELLFFIKNAYLSEYSQIVFRCDLSSFISNNKIIVDSIYFDNSYIKQSLKLNQELNQIKNKFSVNCKRNINKALKNHIIIKKLIDDQALNEFYYLHLLTRKKHGVPVQPFNFFKKLKEVILDTGNGIILTAYRDNIPLASAIFLFDNFSMIYKYGASNPKLLYYRPNEILFFEAIKMAKEKKLEIFDFGISKINNFGLRHFKSGFGATESPVSYSVMSNKPIKKKGKTGDNKVIKFIIRHSPLWLIRLIGELFYKFAA